MDDSVCLNKAQARRQSFALRAEAIGIKKTIRGLLSIQLDLAKPTQRRGSKNHSVLYDKRPRLCIIMPNEPG